MKNTSYNFLVITLHRRTNLYFSFFTFHFSFKSLKLQAIHRTD
jgi:hypothetical protein